MKKLWKTSTAIFLLQLLGFVISYELLDKGNIEKAKVVQAIIAASIAVAAALFMAVKDAMDEEINSPTIFLLAFGAAVIELPRNLIPIMDTIVVLIALVCLLTAVMRERAENESILGCFVTTIPGVGTIVGGVILLYRRLQRHHQVSAM